MSSVARLPQWPIAQNAIPISTRPPMADPPDSASRFHSATHRSYTPRARISQPAIQAMITNVRSG